MKNLSILISFLLFFQQSSAQKISDPYSLMLLKRFDLLKGATFPALEMEREDGTMFNTSSLAGKTVYVDVWFTMCPPCLQEIPYSKALKKYFAADTNIVFLNICIENIERKQAWKDLLKNKGIEGINVFYARNRPQRINLLRELKIYDFPTYYLLNKKMTVIGYDAPRPSDKQWVYWAIHQANQNISVSNAYRQFISNSKEIKDYMREKCGFNRFVIS